MSVKHLSKYLITGIPDVNLFFSTLKSGRKKISDAARAACQMTLEKQIKIEDIDYNWVDVTMQKVNSNCKFKYFFDI